MTAVKEYTCKTCDGPGEYVRPAPGDYRSMGAFRHLTDADHPFVVKPQCPQCRSFDYQFENWDAYADYTRCGSCGHTERFSLGD